MENKVKYGLSNVVVWPITAESDISTTYGTAIPVPGAVTMTLDPVGDYNPFYADDSDYFGEESNDGYDGDVEVALLPEMFETEILSFKKDANGAIIENKNATMKKFGMAFQFKGDQKNTRHVLYRVSGSRPSQEGKTLEEGKKTPTTDKFKFKATGRLDTGDVKTKLTEGSTGYDTFFTSPYVEVPVVPGP